MKRGPKLKKLKVDYRKRYNDYLNSPQWQAKRRAVLATKGWRCQRCGGEENIHIHHATYERLKYENVETDLFVLCNGCHEEYHRIYQKATIKHTKRFIFGTPKLEVKKDKVKSLLGVERQALHQWKQGEQQRLKKWKVRRLALKKTEEEKRKFKNVYNIMVIKLSRLREIDKGWYNKLSQNQP